MDVLLFSIINKTKNHGKAYICKCPECSTVETFSLIEIVEAFYFLNFIKVKASHTFHLACNRCEKQYKLTPEESEAIKSILTQYGANQEFFNSCKSIKIQTLEKESIYKTINTCKSCGEESPGNMVICWNCGAEIEEGIMEEFTELEFVVDPLGATTARNVENGKIEK